jgi:LytS/YehU family sensor histidine kinase
VRQLARALPLVPLTARAVTVHVLAALAGGVAHTAWWALLLITVRPYDRMNASDFLPSWVALGKGLPLELLVYSGVLASVHAVEYYQRYREREVEAAELRATVAQSRLHVLELQMQPHFLFNTLNAISSLVRTQRQEQAVAMIAGLADLLRYTLDHAGEPQVALAEEAHVLRRYLEIQQARFADRLTVEVDVPEELGKAAVPKLILQPLAENALRHGVAQLAGPARITVRAARRQDPQHGEELHLELFNSGTLSSSLRPGIGLQNTRERLQRLYGERHGFELRQVEGGVLACLRLPWSVVA